MTEKSRNSSFFTKNGLEAAGPSRERDRRLVRYDNEAAIEDLFREVDQLTDFDSDDTDCDPNYEPEKSDHDTDSEQECDDSEIVNSNTDASRHHIDEVIELVVAGAGNCSPLPEETTGFLRGFERYFYGRQTATMIKDGEPPMRWNKIQPHTHTRTRQINIITKIPGLKVASRMLGDNPSVEDVWKLLFTADMLEEIVKNTNIKILELNAKYGRKNLSYIQETDVMELSALIGLLVYTSVFKAGNESVHSLFATDGTGRDVFRCTMSKERFLFLLSALRFDDASTRLERSKVDPTAPISNLFQKFIDNCQEMYSMGEYGCIDEMLVAFRGRFKYKMYMPQKPAKYGIKIMAMTDARTNYLCNAFIYSGADCYGKTLNESEKLLKKPSQAVLRLIKPIEGSNRNITCDNWFSSIELAKTLLDKNLTYVGTLKKNKTEIPVEFLPAKDRDVLSSVYGFTKDITLLSYVPKEKKAVIMISTMHHMISDDDETGKPEIIALYNQTKGGVDGLDHKCSNYSSSRRTRRWPMVVFYTIVDVGCGVNAYVLYQSYRNTPRMTRMDFLKMLASKLITPHMTRRLASGYLPMELSVSIKRILHQPQRDVREADQEEPVFEKRKTCTSCPPRLKRKTKYPCAKCGRAICLECAKKVCGTCFSN